MPNVDLSLHPKYRADIDGLRAVAVLSVVGFHLFPGWIHGGFIGVDIFFVISGFLISTIIFGNLEQGTFSFTKFYGRRIRRIFPALLSMLIGCLLFGWFALLPNDYAQLGKHVAGGAGSIANFMLWQEAGYFDHESWSKPLLHLWSLGIEEQFYIIWPPLICLIWKKRFNKLLIIVLITVISFALNVIEVHSDSVAAFYSPQTRFWELLFGAILAWSSLYQQAELKRLEAKVNIWLIRNAAAFMGASLIAYSLYNITEDAMFPGFWALLPTFGTALVIAAGPGAWINRVVLSNRFLVWIGLISFPLYLWHWPLFSFAHIIENDMPTRTARIMVFIVSVVLSWLSYEFIEKPIRFGANSRRKTITLIVLMTIIGCAGYACYDKNGFKSRTKGYELEYDGILKASQEWQGVETTKSFLFEGRNFYYNNSQKKETTLFVGDSNIDQYYPRVAELIKEHPSRANSVIFAVGSGCLPIPGISYTHTHRHCANLAESAMHLVLSKKEITSVVIGGRWNAWFAYGPYKDDYNQYLLRLSSYIKQLKVGGRRVFIMLNIPIGEELDPKYMIQRQLKNFPNVMSKRKGGIGQSVLEEKYGALHDAMKKIALEAGAEAIDPIDYLCVNRFCPSLDSKGDPMYKDKTHLSTGFVREQASFIDKTILSD